MNSRIVKKYANAYFTVAKEEKILKQAFSELKILEHLASNFKETFNDIDSPIFNKSQRTSFVNKIISACKFHNITKNLLHLLAEYGCINSISKIENV